MNRRELLKGILAASLSPAIVRAESLMPISVLGTGGPGVADWDFFQGCDIVEVGIGSRHGGVVHRTVLEHPITVLSSELLSVRFDRNLCRPSDVFVVSADGRKIRAAKIRPATVKNGVGECWMIKS